jgi:hypothetical protein
MADPSHFERDDQANGAFDKQPADFRLGGEEYVADFAFVALWMAGSLAGLMTVALIHQSPLLRKMISRLRLGPNPLALRKSKTVGKYSGRPSTTEALPMLAQAIVGSSKAAVAKVFGPPHIAVISSATPVITPATFWLADTWYYPMPRNGPLALAIRFDDDSARKVDFLGSPVGAKMQ